jgi:hypothetical protein
VAAVPIIQVNPDDPRFQPGAYVTDGTKLYEVSEHDGTVLSLLNCKTLYHLRISRLEVARNYLLVRAAPSCPDRLDSQAA